jgi:uncharacterized protein YecT (DUF1311 family)
MAARWQMRGMQAVLAVFALGCSASTFADVVEDEPRCEEFLKVAIPAADENTSKDASCVAEDLYYGPAGNGAGADPVAARACAWRERDAHTDEPFGGPAILSMLYANGSGVKKNIPLAKRFVCEAGGAPAEVSARLDHLDGSPTGSIPYDVCDDVTSGYMAGFCAQREGKIQSHQRDGRLAALMQSWTPDQRAAYTQLRKAADAYFDKSVSEEVDMSGTLRGAMAEGARQALEDGFVAFLQKCENGELPSGTAAEYKKADAELNAAYAHVMKALKPDENGFTSQGTVKAEGVRRTEVAWIKYRDAWVEFGKVKYPQVSADAWRKALTDERTEDLREMTFENS